MHRLLIAVAVLASTPAIAQPIHTQWTDTKKTLFELVQDGYEVRTVYPDPRNDSLDHEIYVLQKLGSIVRCRSSIRQKAQTRNHPFLCDELTMPRAE